MDIKLIGFRPSQSDMELIENCKELILKNSEIKKLSNTNLLRLALEHYSNYISEKYK